MLQELLEKSSEEIAEPSSFKFSNPAAWQLEGLPS